MDKYYYSTISNPYKIEHVEFIGELIDLLYDTDIIMLNDIQLKEMNLEPNYNIILQKKISKYEDRIPLYDIKFNHIYPIHKDNVYPRIYFNNYRIIDNNFYQDLKSLKTPTEEDKENIRILSFYNIPTLFKTYAKIFYKSFVLNSYITHCRRPSFNRYMDHIMPYYNINELYFLVYDWDLSTKTTLSEEEINSFCKQISKYDISAETLLAHQMYIYDSNAIGLVKHYSLFGSYYINVYLRNTRITLQERDSYEDYVRNIVLENQIKIMIKLIKNAPAFKKSHTVYRFIERDDYMHNLKIGDIYQDPSFMSTTRNPFYYKENYAFGSILIKIKLPKATKGVGLCIESYSNFPNEEEIILPPTSKYKLINIINTSENVYFHNAFNLNVQKKYEFEWVGNDYQNRAEKDIVLKMPDAYEPVIKNIDLELIVKTDDNLKYTQVNSRLRYFQEVYVDNLNNQFSSTVGNYTYVFDVGSYNSMSVYKPFFYYESADGIMMTTANPKYGNINIIMEVNADIHINYYFRFSLTDSSVAVKLSNPEWIKWFSLFAYIIGSKTVIFHSEYELQYNDQDTLEKKHMKTRYTFSQDIYMYLKHKKKLYQFSDIPEINPNFDYFQLDHLFNIPTTDIIKSSDLDELFRVSKKSGIANVGDFYVYIVENYPQLIKKLEEKMDMIYDPIMNPFLNTSYTLDAWQYLNNRSLIDIIPPDKEFSVKKGTYKKLIGNNKIPIFKNRLRSYLKTQIVKKSDTSNNTKQ